MVDAMKEDVGLVHQMPYTCDSVGLPSTLEKVMLVTVIMCCYGFIFHGTNIKQAQNKHLALIILILRMERQSCPSILLLQGRGDSSLVVSSDLPLHENFMSLIVILGEE